MRRAACGLVVLMLLGACATEQSADSADESSQAPQSAAQEPSVRASIAPSVPPQTSTPSPSAEPLAACDLIADPAAAPEGTTSGQPRLETLDDLRDRVEAAAPGSPARAAAEANLGAYEAMGLIERCVITFGSDGGLIFSSGAVTFEDVSGSGAYLDFLGEGCEDGTLPPSATIDATVIVCPSSFPPVAYLAVVDGSVVHVVSASPGPTGSLDEALVQQALDLLEGASK